MNSSLQLGGKNAGILEAVIRRIHEITILTTSFDFYVEQFSDSKAVCQSIRDCMVNIIMFCSTAIGLLNKHMLFTPPPEQLESELDIYISKIRLTADRATKNVQDEHLRRQYNKAWSSPLSEFTSLPRARNPDFFGRQDILTFIDKQVKFSNGHADPLSGSVLLYGLKGVRKTEIANHYAHLRAKSFQWIFWFSADTEEKLKTGVIEVLSAILPIPKDKYIANAHVFFQSWLQGKDRWLIFFDNVETQALLDQYWPRSMNGVVIVTSRNPDVAAQLVSQEGIQRVENMTYEEGANLLKNCISKGGKSQDNNAAISLSTLAGGLPLVVVAIAGFIHQHESSLEEALEIFRSSTDLFHLRDVANTDEAVLRQVWAMSLSRLPEKSAHLLEILSFCDPGSVPEKLILRPSSGSMISGNMGLLESVRGLRAYSFLQRNDGILSVHRLVQDAVLEKMSPLVRSKTLEIVVNLIESSFPWQSDEGLLMSDNWEMCEVYYSQIVSLQKRFHQYGIEANAPIRFAQLLYHCSWFLYERGFFSQSVSLAQTCKGICENSACESRLLLADSLTTISGVEIERCNNQKGYNGLKEALRLRESAVKDGLIEPNHPQIANSYMSLAAAAVGYDKVQEARQLNETSIKIRWENPSSQLQMLSMSYHNLGISHLMNGDPNEALKAIKRSHEIARGSEGQVEENHALAMETRIFYCLGTIWLALEDTTQGQEEHQKALAIRMNYFGKGHHLTACSQYKLGSIAEDDQEPVKASQYYRQSVETLRPGKANFSILLVRSLLGSGMLQLKRGLEDQGTAAVKEAEELFKSTTGNDLPSENKLRAVEMLINPFMR
ncbi:hypothetical protein FE257_004443 [Aspergillus nanangensis]|uniref:NB-ARC domain-containing protein n=1 Tax=Aspergillus nanangensis TaxID=2582783 RepID=A0AAD4GZ88_ASPNN|nr:hypothetical protein FE257_004443 [Aspergillus nanangensis]